MIKRIGFLLLAMLLLAAFAFGCAAPVDDANINIATLKGPTGMGMVQLFEKENYNITLANAPDEVTAGIISGQVDIAAVPINLASVLYNKTGGEVSLIGINTLGVLYILENGNSINTIADLAGKTLYATAKGSTPEYVINYLLEQNGLTDSVTVEYFGEHAELAALMAAGEIMLGMLPEPNVSAALVQNPDLRIALDLSEEWSKVSSTELIQGCIVARNEFIEANPDALESFYADYKASVDFVNADYAVAAQAIAEAEIVPSAVIAQRALPNSNIVFMQGDGAKAAATAMLQVLFEANAQSVGGAMPGEDFYKLG